MKELIMHLSKYQWLLLSAAVSVSVLSTGCYAEVQAEPVVADGYAPQYYDGYVVYYDDYGRPYYYNGGASVYISPGYRGYGTLVNHYQVYRPAYVRWQANYGYRYRTYRRR
jgi:hypothetical protein